MGLDMYLFANKYVHRLDWNERDEENYHPESEDFTALVNTLNCREALQSGDITGIEVKIPVGYWRKSNAIHHWFVYNIADGIDQCQEIHCTKENLEELLHTCRNVLDKKDESFASENLPTRGGFFFGSTDYDQWYWEDIERTIEILENVLKLDYNSFTYQASW